jgi:hypothetical protein
MHQPRGQGARRRSAVAAPSACVRGPTWGRMQACMACSGTRITTPISTRGRISARMCGRNRCASCNSSRCSTRCSWRSACCNTRRSSHRSIRRCTHSSAAYAACRNTGRSTRCNTGRGTLQGTRNQARSNIPPPMLAAAKAIINKARPQSKRPRVFRCEAFASCVWCPGEDSNLHGVTR